MTDESANQVASTEESIDWFLQHMVSIANNAPPTEFGITLSVGGTLVSGYLIGGASYFTGFAEEFADSFESAGAEEDSVATVREAISRFSQLYTEQEERDGEVEEQETPGPSYIHLRDARIFHPGGAPIPANRGVWWRGKLSSIDGFSFGMLSAEIE